MNITFKLSKHLQKRDIFFFTMPENFLVLSYH